MIWSALITPKVVAYLNTDADVQGMGLLAGSKKLIYSGILFIQLLANHIIYDLGIELMSLSMILI